MGMTYLTLGQMARELGCALHRVAYQARRLRLEPALRAGRVRLYTREQCGRVREELEFNERLGDRRRALGRPGGESR